MPEDAEALLAFANKVAEETHFLTFGAGELEMTVEQERDFIANSASRNELMLKAAVDGEVVSLLNVTRSPRKRLHHAGELGISVLRAYWGMGIGRAMLEAMIEWAKGAALRKLNLRVQTENARAIRLYEHLGFSAEGKCLRAHCIDGQFYDEFLMGLKL